MDFFASLRRVTSTVAEWILSSAKKLGIRGGTVVAASTRLGHQGKLHSAQFFEPADQPQEIVLAVMQEEMDKLMNLLAQQEGRIFFVKTPVEFGVVGKGADA